MTPPATKTSVPSPVNTDGFEPDPVESVMLMLERSHDTNCVRCGYELHPTILAGRDRCPECGGRIVLSVANERADLGRLLPLVISFAIGIGTGLTYPMYALFEAEFDPLAGASIAYSAVNLILLTIAIRFRRAYAHSPRIARVVILLVIWAVFFGFWRWWMTRPF